ncbi:MAG: hypothetical protein IT342_20460 [Candidatus Melainabacteria bacterium]|nr:hypothetical protein [Candidatus Melainabacteria bacterium]
MNGIRFTRLSNHRNAIRRRGNMLAMVALLGTIIIVVVLVGFLGQFLLLSHQKERTDADECALVLAHVINDRDRVGQMNTVVERSRELVYGSREAHNELVRDDSDPALEDFSRLLVEEARSGAQLVESSRQMMCGQVIEDLKQSAKDFRIKLKAKAESNVGFMKVSPAALSAVEIGLPRGVFSNATATEAFDALLQADRRSGFVSRAGLAYAGDINAKLPSPDNDLDFKFTPLAGPIGDGVSPPRLTAISVFDSRGGFIGEKEKSVLTSQLPSAVRVKMEAAVGTSGLWALASRLQAVASAAAGGAMRAPDELESRR